MVTVLLCILRLLGFSDSTERQPAYSLERAGLRHVAFIVPESELSLDRVTRMARRFLEANQKSMLAKLSVFTTRDDADRTLCGKGGSDYTYSHWLSWFKASTRAIPAMADVIVMQGTALVRVRDTGGNVHTRVLGNADPLAWKLSGIDFNIVDVVFLSMPPCESHLYPSGDGLAFFAVTDKSVGTQEVLNLTRSIAKVVNVSGLTVRVQNTPWFIDDSSFPLFFRFSKNLEPPQFQDYVNASVHTCTKDRFTFGCVSGHPHIEPGK